MKNYIDKLIEEKNLDGIRREEDKIIKIIEAYEDDVLKSLDLLYIQRQIERYRQIIKEETELLNYIRQKKEELLNLLIESKDEGKK